MSPKAKGVSVSRGHGMFVNFSYSFFFSSLINMLVAMKLMEVLYLQRAGWTGTCQQKDGEEKQRTGTSSGR